ncbi:MAG: methyltransferase [Polyangiales bacterium]
MLADLYRGLSLRYGANADALGPLAPSFVRLDADPDTRAWIDDCFARPVGALQLAARAVARSMMSDYDANGLVGTHDMRVLGTDQWRQLLDGPTLDHLAEGRLLDVGAGDGHVTAALAPLVRDVVTTETSGGMAKRLRKRGWQCHEVDLALRTLPEGERFDLVALLNVLDRTSRPLTLLENLRALAAPDARLLCAVPFPLRPHVHVGASTVDPDELLPRAEPGPQVWERQARVFADTLFAPLGWRVIRVARAPYLCRGPARTPVLQLDDALFVCAPSDGVAQLAAR